MRQNLQSPFESDGSELAHLPDVLPTAVLQQTAVQGSPEYFLQAMETYAASPVKYFFDLFGAFPEGYCPDGYVLLTGVPAADHVTN